MPGVGLMTNDKKCNNCKHSRHVHANFEGHPTYCTVIIDRYGTLCHCKEFSTV